MESPQSRGPTTADEEVYRYYTRVVSLALSALDDGAPSGMPPTEFIEILLGALGFDNSEDWIRFTENDAFRYACCALRLKDDFTQARFFDRNRKQRYAWLEYMGREGNPVIFEHRLQFEHAEDSQPGNLKGHHFSEYRLPIAGLIRDIIANCPVGTHHQTLKKSIKHHAQNYLARFEGTSKRSRKKRVTSAEARLHSSFSNAAKAIQQEEISGGREAAIRRLQEACPPELKAVYEAAFAPKISEKTAQCPHCGKSIDDNIYNQSPDWQNFRSETACNPLGNKPLADAEKLSDFPPEIDVENVVEGRQIQASVAASLPNVLSFINTSDTPVECLPERGNTTSEPFFEQAASPGMSAEEFLAATWPEGETEILSRRDLPVTDRQREALLKGNCFDIPATRGGASDKIAELIAADAFSTFLSLEELQQYDPRGGRGPGKEKRWCCPFDGKTITDEHRDLSVDKHTGEYFCHCCKAAGVLREYLGEAGAARTFTHNPPRAKKKDDRWKEWVSKAKPVRGTPGAAYLEGRGVPVDVAEAARVRYGEWWKKGEKGPEPFNAVIFPVLDVGGNLVAAIARGIHGKTMRTRGELSRGVFLASLDALSASSVAIVEAPIDGLVLAACGHTPIALGGTSIPEWLPDVLAGKDVVLATDNDVPDKFGKRAGDECAIKLASLLAGRATVWRLRPAGAKDWAELAEKQGLDAVYKCLIDASERAPEMEVAQ